MTQNNKKTTNSLFFYPSFHYEIENPQFTSKFSYPSASLRAFRAGEGGNVSGGVVLVLLIEWGYILQNVINIIKVSDTL